MFKEIFYPILWIISRVSEFMTAILFFIVVIARLFIISISLLELYCYLMIDEKMAIKPRQSALFINAREFIKFIDHKINDIFTFILEDWDRKQKERENVASN